MLTEQRLDRRWQSRDRRGVDRAKDRVGVDRTEVRWALTEQRQEGC